MSYKGVAVHTFAGGFLWGVRQAGVQVDKSYEPLRFGTDTLRANGVWVRDDLHPNPLKWPRPMGKIDIVFGNPRCGGFSALGMNAAGDESKGENCRQSVDAEQLCLFGVKVCKAPVVVFESVQQILGAKNIGFVQRMTEEVFEPNGYGVCHVLVNAATFGSCQLRRRYFCVAHKKDIVMNFDTPAIPEELKTVWETIGDLEDREVRTTNMNASGYDYDENCNQVVSDEYHKVMPYLKQGQSINHLHHEKGPEFFMKKGCWRFHRRSMNAKSGLPFGVHSSHLMRLMEDASCPTMIGSCYMWMHPRQDRTLSVRELCRLMGWPDDIMVSGQHPGPQLAKGIIPCAGEWLMREITASMEGKRGTKTREAVEHRGVLSEREIVSNVRYFDFTHRVPKKTRPMFLGYKNGERPLS